ncbi:hypothetical protein Q4F19_17235 [Sphingomonas sp. BIUV-7]|uniref:Uncharacterized protein n=1 Tax=Sphingomonas natans TaxID=3063330 RepID=A0ABT8YCR2_9SPHN|nr:hypothetical protein [Sphingomonas sp. BIUV-7]MDO6416133.1 hypothetical protein [Sphingomonas sp. BIUV-7]
MADEVRDQSETLLARIGNTLDQLLTLEVSTVIAPMTVGVDGNEWSIDPKTGEAAEAVSTVIRLDQGDIRNALSAGAIDNEKLMKLHNDQVTLSRQIVADNLKAVIDLARSLAR